MKSWVLWASLATLLSVGFCQKQTLPIKVLRCFECNANSNAGVTANCHLDPSNPGTKMTCQNDQVCFKEILEKTNGDVVYTRGCIKPPVNFQDGEDCREEKDGNEQDVTKCFCSESECNSVSQIVPMMASMAFALAFLKIVY